jgi:hypothetical protein
VELELSRSALEKNGIRIAAVSYDAPEILAAFAGKHPIGYPLLSDRGSEVIRRFGILNSNMAPELRSYGVPHPVEYLISPDGVVVKKYFVPNYQHRVTGAAVALEQFGEHSADAPVTRMRSGALDAQIGIASGRVFAGQEVGFFARFTLQAGWHIYGSPAPGSYTPLAIRFDAADVLRQDFTFPEPEIVTFPLLNETLPVYSGSFEVHGRLLLRFPLPEGVRMLHGSLRFQQCSHSVCEPPEMIPFELPLTLEAFLISDRDKQLAQEKNTKV